MASITRSMIIALSSLLFSTLAFAQSGDGGAASGNVPGATTDGAVNGSQGSSSSSANISTGATVAIAIVVGLVILGGVSTAILFWQAKKRSWTMKETLRRSTKRVTTGLKSLASPLTPHRATFTPIHDQLGGKEDHKMRGPRSKTPNFSKNRNEDVHRGRDLEKGNSTVTTTNGDKSHDEGPKGHRPKMSVTIPNKKGTTPTTSPETPMWTKFLGRS